MKKNNNTQIFKINDRVRITDKGECYTSYSEMFYNLGFKDTTRNDSCNGGDTGVIFNIGYHDMQKDNIYAVRTDDGRECLMSGRGIELVREMVVDRATITQINDRLAKIESRLDQLDRPSTQPAKPKTAVEWLIDELTSYDYDSQDDYYDICLSLDKLNEIEKTALEMEAKQNCK